MWHPYSWWWYGMPNQTVVLDANGNQMPAQVIYQPNYTGIVISSIFMILIIIWLVTLLPSRGSYID